MVLRTSRFAPPPLGKSCAGIAGKASLQNVIEAAVDIPKYTLTYTIPLWYTHFRMDINGAIEITGDIPMMEMPRLSLYDRQKLQESHKEIIRLVHLGMTDLDIAAQTGFHAKTVEGIRKGTLGQGRLLALDTAADIDAVNIRRRIDGLQNKALDVLESVLADNETTKSLKVKTAQDLLDRGGFGKITKVEDVTGGYLGNGLDRIKERARELGLVKEAEFVSIESTG